MSVDLKDLREKAEAAKDNQAPTIAAIRSCVDFWVSSWYANDDGGDARLKSDGPVAKMLAFLESANPVAVLELLDFAVTPTQRAADLDQAVHEETARLRSQLATVSAALNEACDGWETEIDQSDYPHGTMAKERRATINQLRSKAGRHGE